MATLLHCMLAVAIYFNFTISIIFYIIINYTYLFLVNYLDLECFAYHTACCEDKEAEQNRRIMKHLKI